MEGPRTEFDDKRVAKQGLDARTIVNHNAALQYSPREQGDISDSTALVGGWEIDAAVALYPISIILRI
jgi:hypothetical protein